MRAAASAVPIFLPACARTCADSAVSASQPAASRPAAKDSTAESYLAWSALALRAGARGYVLKDADEDELTGAIRAVARGAAIFSRAVAEGVLAFFAAPRPAPQVFPELTEREREILALIAAGHPNPSIARALHLSPKTVANYVSAIFAKLQVADRAEAMIRAREAGLGS